VTHDWVAITISLVAIAVSLLSAWIAWKVNR